MATRTALTASSGLAESGTTPSLGQLWQVPTFVLGVVALVAAWLTHPLGHEHPLRQLEHDLTTARHLLSRPDGDAETAATHAQRALDIATRSFPEQAGEAAYLLGTAHLRLAE